MHQYDHIPHKEGLYDPALEKDSCGVGFVVHIKGKKSHQIVEDGLTILKNLAHRGACGCDPDSGDGAGLLIQLPHEFLAKETKKLGINLPKPGEYGAGLVFLPKEKAQQDIVIRYYFNN
jgi:glutamate synthase (NADPH/NADH) large chain